MQQANLNEKEPMKLHYTPKSHFARKNRILLDALSIGVELIDVGNVADNNPEIFAHNPLMKVPTLIDGEQVVYESDLISQYIVKKYDPQDRYEVLSQDWESLNAQAVMNGVMTAEVELILAQRTGIDTQKYVRFDKFEATVLRGLQWLEEHASLFENHTYAGFHLVCLWEHLVLYQMFALNYPQLQRSVEQLSDLNFVKTSSPLTDQ